MERTTDEGPEVARLQPNGSIAVSFSIPSSNLQNGARFLVSWFLQRGAGDAAKLAVEWEHLALKEPNLQRRFNPWHLLRFALRHDGSSPPAPPAQLHVFRGHALNLSVKQRPHLHVLLSTPSESVLSLAMSRSRSFSVTIDGALTHSRTDHCPRILKARSGMRQTPNRNRPLLCETKEWPKSCKEWQHRMNVNGEQQKERARMRSRSLRRLRRKAANQNERNCQHSVKGRNGILGIRMMPQQFRLVGWVSAGVWWCCFTF